MPRNSFCNQWVVVPGLNGERQTQALFLPKTGGLLANEEELFWTGKDDLLILESEFIFGTNRDALSAVIEGLEQEDDELDSRN